MSIANLRAQLSAAEFEAKAIAFGKMVSMDDIKLAIETLYKAGPEDDDGSWIRLRDDVLVPRYLAQAQEVWGADELSAADLSQSFDITIYQSVQSLVQHRMQQEIVEKVAEMMHERTPGNVHFVDVDNLSDFVEGPATVQ